MPSVSDIAQKIRARSYAAPGRARAAISRSDLPQREKHRLNLLVDEWQHATNGHADMPVIGALPAGRDDDSDGALEGEVVERPRLELESSTVNLNTRVIAKLTVAGVAILHQARGQVLVPPDLLARGGVWETELWEFMRVFGPHLHAGIGPDLVVTESNLITLVES